MNAIVEMYAGILLVAVSVGLALCYFTYLRWSSNRRRLQMLQRVGLGSHEGEGDVRARCQRCPSEALCERWLAGEDSGDNGFCPNARTFNQLKSA